MPNNDFSILLQALLNENASISNIDSNIDTIQGKVKNIQIKAILDPKSMNYIAEQISKAVNQKISISNIDIKQGQITKSVQQIGQNVTNSINAAEQKLIQTSTSAANTIIQNEKRKQQAYNETAQAAKSMNGIVQNGSFPKNFLVSELNGSTKEVENTFKKLSSIVSIEERLGDATNLKGFTVSLTNADGVVEKLRYHLNEAGDAFTYMGGSVNNTGVEKQINSINERASKLQNTFEGLKSKYSDLNVANPIKEVSHISELETQYKKVSQAIEAVKNSNSATFSSMTSNAEKEIKTLQRMGEEFKRAETISMRMNGSDISSGLAQAQERFQKLKADSAGFTQMVETIQKLDTAIATVGDKSSLKTFIDQLKVAEAQLVRVKAETRSMSQVNKIQFSLETGGYESKVESLISRTRQWTNEQGNARISTEALSKAFTDLNTAHDTLAKNNTAANQQALINAEKELDTQIKRVTNSVRTMNAQLAKDSTISSLHNRIQEFYDKNSAAHSKWGAQLKRMLAETASGAKLTHEQVRGLSTEFNNVGIAARQAGRLGKSFTQTLREGMKSFSYWTSSTFLVMKMIQSIKKAVSTVKELDTALVDLKKTTTMTASQLEEFYYNANDVAKQMGVTTNEIISQASAWSRLGFSSAEAATKMAKYSAMFKLISPGMDLDSATDGLVSIMKAFKIGLEDTDEVVDGIMSKINIIGNSKALNNSDIVDFLTRSSSALSSANNSIEESIAMGEAIVEITRDAAGAGQVMKTTSMRIRGYDEELEAYTDDMENLKGKIADLTKTAQTPGGISLFTDSTKETYKSTYKILEEISGIWDDLTDKNQAELLEVLAGKRNGQALAALISNFDSARGSMELMADSAGNAEAELAVTMDTVEYRLNRLKETWGTGIAQNLFEREDMKLLLDFLTKIGEGFDALTSKIGLFGTIGVGAGVFGIRQIVKNFA